MNKEKREQMRWFLTDKVRKVVDWRHTDQYNGLPAPPLQKPAPKGSQTVTLPGPTHWKGLGEISLRQAIAQRKSHRVFTETPLSLEELAFLLWSTQGVRHQVGPHTAFRTVPSAGGRHPFETYVVALRVEGLEKDIYRYLPLDHELVPLKAGASKDEKVSAKEGPAPLEARLIEATLGQGFCGKSAATFVWTTIPYRTEWRYDLAAYRVIPMDAGHLCQNLYLACEGVGAGTCAVAAYDQEKIDELLGVDGFDEFTLYLAPVGKLT